MKSYIDIGNGNKMPIIGLGTWQAENREELENAIDEALKIGYRHFDLAYNYLNEHIIGDVFKKWLSSGKIKREELFIVTKLPMIGMEEGKVGYFLKKSLSALNLDYVDLYLVHCPIGFQNTGDEKNVFPVKDGKVLIDKSSDIVKVWKGMEAQVDEGLAKTIGISNFNENQIERIVKNCRIRPANIQVEVHAYFQQKELRAFCKKHNISVCAYAPFGSPGRKTYYEKRGLKIELPSMLEDEKIVEIAKKYGKTSGQILLKFLAQQDVIVIPKSTNAVRLKQNFEIFDFELTAPEIKELEALDKGEAGRSFTLKSFPGAEDHPETPF